MSSRRLYSGLIGTDMRFRTAAFGTDAKTAPDNASGITFDSNYTDTLPIHTILNVVTPAGTTNQEFSVSFPALGYVPLFERYPDFNQPATATTQDFSSSALYLACWCTNSSVNIRTIRALANPNIYLPPSKSLGRFVIFKVPA